MMSGTDADTALLVAAILGGAASIFALIAAWRYRRQALSYGALEARPRHPASHRPTPTPSPPPIDPEEVRRLRAALSDSDRSLRALADIASRDLRTPVRGIDNLVGCLRHDLDRDATPEVAAYLDRIESRAHDIGVAVDDIVQLVAAETHHDAATETDVASLVHYVVATIDLRSSIDIELAIDLPPVSVTATPLASCVRGLIDNAVRHHHDPHHGHIVVTARLAGGDRLIVAVEDDGPGFDPALVRRRIRAAGDRLGGVGEGVGLQVISRICDVHDASLMIHSEPGAGSICSLHWPVTVIGSNETRSVRLDAEPVIDLRDPPSAVHEVPQNDDASTPSP